MFAFPKQLINQSYIQHPMQIELIKGLIKCFIFELFLGSDLAVFNGFNLFIIALSKQVATDSNYNTVMLVAKNRLDNLRWLKLAICIDNGSCGELGIDIHCLYLAFIRVLTYWL